MTESALPDLGCKAGAWNALVRRARIGRERKLAALTVGSYADKNGRDIRCGVARLAVDCEIGYSTARRHLSWLRKVGLIEVTKKGNRRIGRADEYRLILGPDVLEHLDVPDPTVYMDMIEQVRESNRAGSATREQRRRDLRSPESILGIPEGSATSVGSPVLRSPMASAEADGDPGGSALTLDERRSGFLRSPDAFSALTLDERTPPINTSPEVLPPTSDGEKVRTELEVARATTPEDQKISPRISALTPACPSHHGGVAGLRPDGTPACPFCRRRVPPTRVSVNAPPSALANPDLSGDAA